MTSEGSDMMIKWNRKVQTPWTTARPSGCLRGASSLQWAQYRDVHDSGVRWLGTNAASGSMSSHWLPPCPLPEATIMTVLKLAYSCQSSSAIDFVDFRAFWTFLYMAIYCAGWRGRDRKSDKGGKKEEKKKEWKGNQWGDTELFYAFLVRGLFLPFSVLFLLENVHPFRPI